MRVRVNGEVHDLSESFDLDKQKWHDIEVVVDRLVIGASAEQTRVADSVETALKMASGTRWWMWWTAMNCCFLSSSPAFTAISAWAA